MRTKSFLVTIEVNSKSDVQEAVFTKALKMICDVATLRTKNTFVYLKEIIKDGPVEKFIDSETRGRIGEIMQFNKETPADKNYVDLCDPVGITVENQY